MAVNKKLKETIWQDFTSWISTSQTMTMTDDQLQHVKNILMHQQSFKSAWDRIQLMVPTLARWHVVRKEKGSVFYWVCGYLEGQTEVIQVDHYIDSIHPGGDHVDHQAGPGIHL